MDERGEQAQVGDPAMLGRSCPSCSTENLPDARFCQSCGTELPQPEPEPSEPGPRLVTVLVALLRAEGDGSDRGARRARTQLAAVAGRYGGEVFDDERGFAAVFGLHPAHGDGALRAVRAAADLCETGPALADRLTRTGDPPVGIAVGVAVVTSERTAPLIDPSAAFDLAERAAAGEAFLSGETHRRAGPASVEVVPLGGQTAPPPVAEPDDSVDPRSDDDSGDVSGDGPAEGEEGEGDAPSPEPADATDPDAASDDTPENGSDTAIGGSGDDDPVRLVSVVAANAGQAPVLHAPIIGRDAERVALRELFDRAVQDRTSVAVTVVGSPGIGKTRLAEALISWAESAHDAIAIRVRCRDASDGGAAWPLAELIEQAIGVTLDDAPADVEAALGRALEDAPDASPVRERLAQVLAMPGGRAISEETPWAIRRLLELLAAHRPVIVLIDDADGADPSFARLLRAVADRVDAPVLMLATGRADPLHGTADENAVATLTLEPLDVDGVSELLAALVGRSAFGDKAQQRVATATGGNPFLIEQLTCMLVDEGLLSWDEGRWLPTTDLSAMPTPPNVAALLEARLHAISTDERAVLERLAVAGERIRWDGFLALLPDDARPAAGDRLAGLARKQLVRAPEDPGDDLVAIQHAFVRDAVARTASAQVRAEVHEWFAGWLVDVAADRTERFDEPIGAALERAYRARTGVGGEDGSARTLARDASVRLDAAARRAAEIGDAQGAFQLAQRAASLVARDDPTRPGLLLRAAIALADLGQHARADALLTETAHAARATGERAVEWRAKVLRARLAAGSGTDHRALESARRRADRSVAVFRDLGDDWGSSWAWSLSAFVSLCRGHASATAAAAGRAAETARRAGITREEGEALRALARALADGPIPLDESASRLAAIVDRVGDTHRSVAQEALGVLAIVQAGRGNMDEARALDERAAAIVDELGLETERSARAERSGIVRLLAGDLEGARDALREGLALTEKSGDHASGARIAAVLAHVLEDAGEYGEAVRLTEVAEQGVAPSDVATSVRWRTARARALAHGGNLAQANGLARQAVRLADQTDGVELRATALVELAEVLRLSGRRNEAMPLARRALRAFSRKGAMTRVARAQRLLDELDQTHVETPVADRQVPEPPEQLAVEQVEYAHAVAAPTPASVPEAPPPPPEHAERAEPEAFGDRIEQEFAALQDEPESARANGDRAPGAAPEETGEDPGQGADTPGQAGGKDPGRGRKGLRFW